MHENVGSTAKKKLKTMRGLFSNNSVPMRWENAGTRRNLVYKRALKSLAAGNEYRITVILSPTPIRDLLSQSTFTIFFFFSFLWFLSQS